jgi:hypothetical protein
MTLSTERSTTIAAANSVGRMPDFFIVGHPKCGTTALYAMLKRHPQIYLPELKEPWFFAEDLRARLQEPAIRLPDTLEEYLSLFAAAESDQRVGEASPSYLLSRTAARAIAVAQPAARSIAILREPVSFLRSLHLQLLQSHTETEKDLRKALSLEHDRREGRRVPPRCRRPPMLIYSDHVRYVEQLRRYHDAFPAEQLLVLVYDDFRADNEATVRRVLRFLDVDDTAPMGAGEINPTVRVRARRLYELIHAISMSRGPMSRAVKATARRLTAGALTRESAVAIRDRLLYASPRPPDESLTLELRGRFKAEVEMLSEYLGRDLVTLWGYDHVG